MCGIFANDTLSLLWKACIMPTEYRIATNVIGTSFWDDIALAAFHFVRLRTVHWRSAVK